MPVETLAPSVESKPVPAPLGARLLPESCGWVEFHPRFRERLAAQKLLIAEAFLELQGEIVSGHPDRHVVRIQMPGWTWFLKVQHAVRWRERLRQRVEQFGWSSRCTREARVLKELERQGFACPQWVAFGEDGSGRAFLLVEELAGCVELRRLLSDNELSPEKRSRLVEKLGHTIAELHSAGFTTPDLTAKHVFVNPETLAVTLIDWQSARKTSQISEPERMRFLAAFDASLTEELAGPRDRLRFFWACSRVYHRRWKKMARCSQSVREITRFSVLMRERRSIRDQRQPPVPHGEQRLVWLAGEAVCAIPEIASGWPKPAIAPPFYTDAPADQERLSRIRLPDGRDAELLRGKSFAPLARLAAAIRGKPWRSAGAILGRVLFHLQRYGIPAPQLYAFGQRDTGWAKGEWFVLYAPPMGRPLPEWLKQSTDDDLRRDILKQVTALQKRLSMAGCGCTNGESPFWVTDAGRVMIGNIRAIRMN